MTSVFGPVLTLPRIKGRVVAHTRLWMPTYLRAIEREEGVRADGVTPLAAGTLPLPKSWTKTNGRVDKWPAAQLPAVIFSSPGLSDSGAHRYGTAYQGTWAFGLTTVASARDADSTEWLCGLYTAALRLLFIQQPVVGGLPVKGCSYADEAYDELPFSRSGSLMAGTATFELELGDLGDVRLGPLEPAADPVPRPGDGPEVQTTALDLERSPLA